MNVAHLPAQTALPTELCLLHQRGRRQIKVDLIACHILRKASSCIAASTQYCANTGMRESLMAQPSDWYYYVDVGDMHSSMTQHSKRFFVLDFDSFASDVLYHKMQTLLTKYLSSREVVQVASAR